MEIYTELPSYISFLLISADQTLSLPCSEFDVGKRLQTKGIVPPLLSVQLTM